MPRKAKLVLPTIDSCQWRSHTPDGTSCGLITELLGKSSAFVSDDACNACCKSFPPSPRQLNPVVASLLYQRAQLITDVNGTDECELEQAERVKDESEIAFNLVRSSRLTMLPVRSSGRCCWLGAPKSDTTSNTTTGPTPDSLDLPHRCLHPNHNETSLAKCRMCRDWSQSEPVSRVMSLDELLPVPSSRYGTVKSWAVGVTTAPRRESTLETTLDSITRAGWSEPRVFMDGTTHLPDRYSHLPITWREDSVGAWPSWYLALAELVLHEPHADAYMLLQDDVILYDRESLREYLERVLWPGDRPGLVSMFYTGLNSPTGWLEAKGEWHFSAQGFIIPPGIARALLCDPDVSRGWLAASSQTHIPIPEMISDWAHKRSIDIWYANPSLLQHIGNTSTIWMNAAVVNGRRAPWYSGSVETEVSTGESLADFAEEDFACSASLHQAYQDRVDAGKRHMRNQRVVICGLCRDVRPYLPRTAARVERLGGMFADYRVVLFENDSTDATCEFLSDWQNKNSQVDVISQRVGAVKYPQTRSLARAAWLAHCRNIYRERIVEQLSDFEHVIVVDMDLPGGWSYDGVAHTFGDDDWDFVGSYGITPRLDRRDKKPPVVHHDVWAFRPAVNTPARKLVNHNDLHLQRGEPLLPVESCFGGLGVYRMECMKAAEYSGSDCEHVDFHSQLRGVGLKRLFLNPSQITLY